MTKPKREKYSHLYSLSEQGDIEHQAKLAEPKDSKVVKFKHFIEHAYKSLKEAKRLQEGIDE